MQEACTNTIKYSRANTITVQTVNRLDDSGDNWIDSVIRDNGTGFDDNIVNGQGLKNIRQRAEKMDANVRITSSADGTAITIGFRAGD